MTEDDLIKAAAAAVEAKAHLLGDIVRNGGRVLSDEDELVLSAPAVLVEMLREEIG